MVFSSAVFLLLYLPIVFIGNMLIKNEISNYFLLAASILFYAWGEPKLVFLMIFSILINYCVGVALDKAKGKWRKVFLALGILLDLSILGYYKYEAFFARIVNKMFHAQLLPVLNIALPIGISFFTFQAISYIVDVYRGDTEASKSIVNVALYISFFPQLIAGPIVKYKDINEQIKKRSINWIDVSDGFKRFIYGLSKKVLISNALGLCVDTIYSFKIENVDCRAAWIAALAYTFQIYYDFSGYSDMAIGLGKMFGFTILENFNYPYLSRSISEFWRRWHISLGSWFREYLYIPLGGNKKGKVRTYINLIIVFFLTGLWHGADMSFVIWGLYHGFFSIIERIGLNKILKKLKVLPVLYTFFIVNIGWVLFRAKDTITGLRFLIRMFLPWRHPGVYLSVWEYLDYRTLFFFGCAIIGIGLLKGIPEKIRNKWNNSVIEALYCIGILFLSISSIASDTYNPFIYFQF